MKTTIVSLFAVLFVGALSCFAGSVEIVDAQTAALSKKLDAIIIPRINFMDANIVEGLEFIKNVAKENDPDKTGVNVVLQDKENNSKLTLNIENISLRNVLKLVAEQSGLSMFLEDGLVVLRKQKDKK